MISPVAWRWERKHFSIGCYADRSWWMWFSWRGLDITVDYWSKESRADD